MKPEPPQWRRRQADHERCPLAPIQKGVRIIREISWRWREIGGDSRICDILEWQAGAIEKAHSQLAARDDVAALHSAFSLIETTLDGLWNSPSSKASPSALKTASPTTSDEAVTLPEEAASHEQAMAEAAVVEPKSATTTARDAPVAAADRATTANYIKRAPAVEVSEKDIAHDDAVLDMIALEMGAPDFEKPATDHANIDRPETVELAPTAEPIADSSDARIDPEPEFDTRYCRATFTRRLAAGERNRPANHAAFRSDGSVQAHD